MASPRAPDGLLSSGAALVSNHTARAVLLYLHYANPIILLIFFLVAFTTHSILTSPNRSANGSSETQTGPGGKPLPKTKPQAKDTKRNGSGHELPRSQRLLFQWLSFLATLTFAANAVDVIVHALYDRRDGWWCGQSVVVSSSSAAALVQKYPDAPRGVRI